MHDDLRSAINCRHAETQRAALADLIRLPSVSADGFDPANVLSTGEHLVVLLSELGFADAQLLHTTQRVIPAVFAQKKVDERKLPTVLLYAHYDVQPPGPAEEWEQPSFRARRGERTHLRQRIS